jgi:hypothetical protein
VPDDLLRFVTGPTPLGSVWWLLPGVLAAVLVGWYVGVFAMTAAPRSDGVVQRARDALARRRHLAAVRSIRARLAAGVIDADAAGAELNRTLRGFLQRATGSPVEYMRVAAMTDTAIASTAGLFKRLDDARFNARTEEDVDDLGAAVEKVIASWT